MMGYTGIYCIERGERNIPYKRTKLGGEYPIFPMSTAYIIHDSHDAWIVGTLFYEPLARGTSGGKVAAEKAARQLQRKIDRFVYETPRYITRGGVTVTEKKDIYKIG